MVFDLEDQYDKLYRYCYFKLRHGETAEDITLSYVATESRITALETEQKRLLELLAKADSMNDILQIEARLTDVRTELEEVNSKLRLYDNQINYATIYLNLSEVKEYTIVTEPETVWQRISTGFMSSLKGLGKGCTEVFIFLIANLPYLVFLSVIITCVIIITRIYNKRKKKKNKQSQEQ